MLSHRLIAASCGLVPLIACLGINDAWAQEPEYALPPLIVSATQIATPPEQIGSDVTIITADDIARNQWRTLPDVLRDVPGLYVAQSGGPGGVASVFIRGTNSNHVKVLIDGIDVSDPSSPNGAFDFSQVLVSDIARIEVLRGPQSGLYGSDAIGGVIVIETKKGAGAPHVEGTVEGGSFGTFNQSAGLSGATERFNYQFDIQHFRSTDTPVTPLDLLPPGVPLIPDLYDNLTLSTRLGADFSDQLGASFIGRYTYSSLDFTGDDDVTGEPAAEQSTQTERNIDLRGEGRLTLLGGAFDNRFGISYADDFRREFDPTAFEVGDLPFTDTNGRRIEGDWRGKYLIAPEETLIFGAEAETDQMFASPLADYFTATEAQIGDQAAYAEWQGKIIDRLYGAASLRFDHNDRFGSAVTWHVAPTYSVTATDTQLKASAGTGFKAPTLNQLYVSYPAFGFFANPNLEPERSLGFDAGFEQPFDNGRWRFGADYFHNDIRDLIDYNDSFTTLINIGHATTQGAETFLTFAVTPRLDLRGDYTYTLAMDDVTGTELLRRPKHKASLQASWRPLDDVTLTATLLYVGTRLDISRDGLTSGLQAPPYTVINLDGSYQLTPSVALFARIENLLNEHYEDIIGFLRPGLGVFGGVRVSLNGPTGS